MTLRERIDADEFKNTAPHPSVLSAFPKRGSVSRRSEICIRV